MSRGVIVKNIEGNVTIQKEGKITYIKGEQKLQPDAEYQIIVDEKSYALIFNKAVGKQKQDTQFLMYPKSMMMVRTGNGFIQSACVVLGMVFGTMPAGYKMSTHTAEFEGSGLIFADDNGNTIIAHTGDIIYNKLTGAAIQMDAGQQVAISMNAISPPQPMEERFSQAVKVMENLGSFEASAIYKTAASKADEFKAAYMMAMKELSAQTGYDISNLDNELKVFDDYKKGLTKKSEESTKIAEEVTRTTFSEAAAIPVSISFTYKELEGIIDSVRIEKKQSSSMKVTIFLKMKNNRAKPVFIFWNEECRIINKNNEIIDLEDYSIATDFSAVQEEDGYLVFIAKSELDNPVIQFGKKSAPQHSIPLPIPPTV